MASMAVMLAWGCPRRRDRLALAEYRSTRKAVFTAKYHVIWCPKHYNDTA